MINIIDNRFKNSCRLCDVDDGECFIVDGILFRKIHSDSSFGNIEYMYSGIQADMEQNAFVTPVDVVITITNESEVCDE